LVESTASYFRQLNASIRRAQVLSGAIPDYALNSPAPTAAAQIQAPVVPSFVQEIQQRTRLIGLTREQIENEEARRRGIALLTDAQRAFLFAETTAARDMNRWADIRESAGGQLAVAQQARAVREELNTAAEWYQHLLEQNNNLQLTELELGERRLAQMRSVSPILRESLQWALRQREQLQEIVALRGRANQVREQVTTPGEAFQARLADLNAMRDEGALSPANFARAAAQAFDQLMAATQIPDRGAPAALLKDSIEAQNAINRASRDERRNMVDPMVRLQQVMEQQRLIQQQQRDYMRQFVELARDGFVAQMGN
jgi:hypothetical protein